jgi:hypothetical protein
LKFSASPAYTQERGSMGFSVCLGQRRYSVFSLYWYKSTNTDVKLRPHVQCLLSAGATPMHWHAMHAVFLIALVGPKQRPPLDRIGFSATRFAFYSAYGS